jgi:hypothetical protein
MNDGRSRPFADIRAGEEPPAMPRLSGASRKGRSCRPASGTGAQPISIESIVNW